MAPKEAIKLWGEESGLAHGKCEAVFCLSSRVPGPPTSRKPCNPHACKSVSEAHILSLTAGNILGVLTWGYTLKNGPLRYDLSNIEITLLNALKVVHAVGSTGPDFPGQTCPRPSQMTVSGEGAGGERGA